MAWTTDLYLPIPSLLQGANLEEANLRWKTDLYLPIPLSPAPGAVGSPGRDGRLADAYVAACAAVHAAQAAADKSGAVADIAAYETAKEQMVAAYRRWAG